MKNTCKTKRTIFFFVIDGDSHENQIKSFSPDIKDLPNRDSLRDLKGHIITKI